MVFVDNKLKPVYRERMHRSHGHQRVQINNRLDGATSQPLGASDKHILLEATATRSAGKGAKYRHGFSL
jgi:hypothetical protein